MKNSIDVFRALRWLSRALRQGSLCLRSLGPTEIITFILECTTAMNDHVSFHIDLNIVHYFVIYIWIYFVQYDVQYRPSCHAIENTRKYEFLKLLRNSVFLHYVPLKPFFRVRFVIVLMIAKSVKKWHQTPKSNSTYQESWYDEHLNWFSLRLHK